MLPSIVNICGIPHSVRLCSDNFTTDTLHFGEINYAHAEILINEDISPELQMQTLFHEMLHGILVQLGYSDESQDEQFVTALSNALYQCFALKP